MLRLEHPLRIHKWFGEKADRALAAQHLPGLLQVQQGHAKAVDKSVATGQDTVIEEEPSLVGLNGNGACADLCGAPGAIERRHDVTMTAPISEIGTFAIENLPKGGVAVVAGAGEHGIVSVYFSGKQYAIAVTGQKGIFKLVKIFEIIGVGETDGRAMIAVAPSYIIAIFDKAYPGIIAIYEMPDLRIVAVKSDGGWVNLPVNGILTFSGVEAHFPRFVIHTEYTTKFIAKGDHGAVKNTVCTRDGVSWDYGILLVAPNVFTAGGRFFLPWNIWQGTADDFGHRTFILSYFKVFNECYYSIEKREIPVPF